MIEVESFQAGKYVQSGEHRCFVPSLVNDAWSWENPEINDLLEKASYRLGELKGLSRMVPNLGLFILLSSRAEANASSRIEGTRTELDEVVKPEHEVLPERRDDWHEVQNYIAALTEARETPRLPISSRLIKQAHKTLMSGGRGKNKAPGEFRKVQNYLLATEVSEIFYPPPASEVDALMSNLEKFLHNDRIKLPSLIRIAIAHYQFETIHPFLDGNGRIGRLIIPLYLADRQMTHKPLLYMSRYLEKNKMRYYDNLIGARNGDIARWLKFFLIGAAQAATDATRALMDMLDLEKSAAQKIRTAFKRGDAARTLLAHLFTHPVISISDAAKACKITPAAAGTLVHKMCDTGLLRETTGRSRNRLFIFREYLDIFDH